MVRTLGTNEQKSYSKSSHAVQVQRKKKNRGRTRKKRIEAGTGLLPSAMMNIMIMRNLKFKIELWFIKQVATAPLNTLPVFLKYLKQSLNVRNKFKILWELWTKLRIERNRFCGFRIDMYSRSKKRKKKKKKKKHPYLFRIVYTVFSLGEMPWQLCNVQ